MAGMRCVTWHHDCDKSHRYRKCTSFGNSRHSILENVHRLDIQGACILIQFHRNITSNKALHTEINTIFFFRINNIWSSLSQDLSANRSWVIVTSVSSHVRWPRIFPWQGLCCSQHWTLWNSMLPLLTDLICHTF